MNAASPPDLLRMALREWAVVCAGLTSGQGCLVVRKGGIHERRGGLFSLEHDRFVLLPSWLHQDQAGGKARLRPAWQGLHDAVVANPPHPAQHRIAAWASAEAVWKLRSLDQVLALGDELPYSEAELQQRLSYRGEPWVAVVLLRAWVLEQPQSIADAPQYAGCRSWVPLADAVRVQPSRPAIADAAWATRRACITTLIEAQAA